MKIACLGWGSLIWDSGQLPLASEWQNDGPYLPIEFARESSDGRITLVIVDNNKTTPALWALLNVDNIESAKATLAKREGVSERNIRYPIGYWESVSGASNGRCSEKIKTWALGKGLDGVVWTNLKYGFKDTRGVMPEISMILNHFNSLSPQSKSIAEEYVRKTPAQVKTEFRNVLEEELGWKPISTNA